MSQLVRVGCAGVAVIIVAALTSVGLFAVLTGGSPFAVAAPKPIAGGVQALVTIQAGQPTATPPSASTPTPNQAQQAGAPGPLAASVAVAAAAPPTATPTVTPAPTPQTAALPQPSASLQLAASPGAAPGAPSTPGRPGGVATVNHDGLTAEIIEIERGWQPTDAAGKPLPIREGHELVTVHVRLANGANEARYVADADVTLAADDGARYAARTTSPFREPRLLTHPLLPGDHARGWLTYEVPVGAATPRLQWSPTRPDRPRADATYNLPLSR